MLFLKLLEGRTFESCWAGQNIKKYCVLLCLIGVYLFNHNQLEQPWLVFTLRGRKVDPGGP